MNSEYWRYLLYFGSTIAMVLIAGFVYVRFTPSDEITLIRRGNVAAAVALGGAMMGYACVVHSATAHGSTVSETAMWSAIALAIQIIAVELLRLVIRDDWKAQIESGDIFHIGSRNKAPEGFTLAPKGDTRRAPAQRETPGPQGDRRHTAP